MKASMPEMPQRLNTFVYGVGDSVLPFNSGDPTQALEMELVDTACVTPVGSPESESK